MYGVLEESLMVELSYWMEDVCADQTVFFLATDLFVRTLSGLDLGPPVFLGILLEGMISISSKNDSIRRRLMYECTMDRIARRVK
ncbi:unnamed protein product [Cochlearia groenlandica]